MPENLYFRQPQTQRILMDILFVYSKLNPDVGYRQGMHEILAPILWVVERDAIDLGLSSKTLGEEAVVKAVFDADHVEHDAFALFTKIMESAKSFYEQTTHEAKDNPIILRSRRIFDDLLPQVDPDLARHLDKIDVVPQIFLIKWLRLLFGREFPFDDVLLVWDVLFAEDTSLELVDYICVAMLLRIRWELLDADYNAALTLLLRYPEPDKVHVPQTLAADALYLRENMSIQAGSYLVLKYTGRNMDSLGRPATPPALQRNITTFSGGRSRPTSPSDRPRFQRNIESVLQSTAKNIYARGGQAVRSAVDEVHKRAQEIRDTQTPRLPPRGYGPLYNRIKSLEQRNRNLSQLLDGALAELWAFQKLVADTTAGEQEKTGTLDVEQLCFAIAKVQFVQVYLSDPSLSLPDTDSAANSNIADMHGGQSSDATSHEDNSKHHDAFQRPANSQNTPQDYGEPPGILPDPSTFDEDFQTGVPISLNESRDGGVTEAKMNDMPEEERESGVMLTQSDSSAATTDAIQQEIRERPTLAESSYSWMLGQEDSRSPPPSRLAAESSQKSTLFGEQIETTVLPKQEKRKSGSTKKQKHIAQTMGEDVLGRQ
jgi:TBC1 domain family member 5